ncbi:ABC transporter F family member 4-like [Papaver somniferum]|uniref:ABC transporter F family member 4-like n=1 Tax=Papaver somniferum TaxID=3469 RepID=UPI000E703647|nr:ABC transporter F family member 4-like [Papaver somniferum]
MSKRTRTKYATNRNHPSADNPELVQAIRNKTKEVQQQAEVDHIAQEEEMSRIRKKNQAEKKYKKKYDHATPNPLRPRRKDGKNLNASHLNPRATGSKAKGIIINDPPPQAEQPTHEESDSETPTEQEGCDKQGGEEEIHEEVNEEQSGGKEGGEEEKRDKKGGEEKSDESEGDEEEGDKEDDKEIREVVQEQVQDQEVQQQDQGGDPKGKGIPGDGGNVLWGYKGSWAGVVYNTIDHKHVVRLMKPVTSVSKMRQWPLIADESTIGEVPKVVDLVNSTGLLPAVNNLGHLDYDIPFCSAFVKRYYAETDTLHLPFGEMTITPNDAKFITGLRIEEADDEPEAGNLKKKNKSKKKIVSDVEDEKGESDSDQTLVKMKKKAKKDAEIRLEVSDPEATLSRKSQRLKDQVSPQVSPSSPRPEKPTKGKKKAKNAAPKEVLGDDTDNEDAEDVRQAVDHQKKRKRHEPKQSKDLKRMKNKQIERSKSEEEEEEESNKQCVVYKQENRDKYEEAFLDATKIIEQETCPPDSAEARLQIIEAKLKDMKQTQERNRQSGVDFNENSYNYVKELLVDCGHIEVQEESSGGPSVNVSSAEPSDPLSQNFPRNETLVELVSLTEPPTQESVPEVIRLDSQEQTSSQGRRRMRGVCTKNKIFEEVTIEEKVISEGKNKQGRRGWESTRKKGKKNQGKDNMESKDNQCTTQRL